MKRTAAFVFLGSVLASSIAFAQAPQPAPLPQAAPPAATAQPAPLANPDLAKPLRRGAMRSCRTDVATHCATAPQGGGARVACLIENRAKLSADCAAALAQIAEARGGQRGSMRACRADAQVVCKGERGRARRQCLETNRTQLSPDCQAALAALPPPRGGAAMTPPAPTPASPGAPAVGTPPPQPVR